MCFELGDVEEGAFCRSETLKGFEMGHGPCAELALLANALLPIAMYMSVARPAAAPVSVEQLPILPLSAGLIWDGDGHSA